MPLLSLNLPENEGTIAPRYQPELAASEEEDGKIRQVPAVSSGTDWMS